MATGTASLFHPTAGRPLIPSNRRRHPTVERNFSGVTLPLLSLEQDLEKASFARQVSQALQEVSATGSRRSFKIKSDDSERHSRTSSVDSKTDKKASIMRTRKITGKDVEGVVGEFSTNSAEIRNIESLPQIPAKSIPNRTGNSKPEEEPRKFVSAPRTSALVPSAEVVKPKIQKRSRFFVFTRLYRFRSGNNRPAGRDDQATAEPSPVERSGQNHASVNDAKSVNERTAGPVLKPAMSFIESKQPSSPEFSKSQASVPRSVISSESVATASTGGKPSSDLVEVSGSTGTTTLGKSKSAKELADRAKTAVDELRKGVDAANATAYSSFLRKAEGRMSGVTVPPNQFLATDDEDWDAGAEPASPKSRWSSKRVSSPIVFIPPNYDISKLSQLELAKAALANPTGFVNDGSATISSSSSEERQHEHARDENESNMIETGKRGDVNEPSCDSTAQILRSAEDAPAARRPSIQMVAPVVASHVLNDSRELSKPSMVPVATEGAHAMPNVADDQSNQVDADSAADNKPQIPISEPASGPELTADAGNVHLITASITTKQLKRSSIPETPSPESFVGVSAAAEQFQSQAENAPKSLTLSDRWLLRVRETKPTTNDPASAALLRRNSNFTVREYPYHGKPLNTSASLAPGKGHNAGVEVKSTTKPAEEISVPPPENPAGDEEMARSAKTSIPPMFLDKPVVFPRESDAGKAPVLPVSPISQFLAQTSSSKVVEHSDSSSDKSKLMLESSNIPHSNHGGDLRLKESSEPGGTSIHAAGRTNTMMPFSASFVKMNAHPPYGKGSALRVGGTKIPSASSKSILPSIGGAKEEEVVKVPPASRLSAFIAAVEEPVVISNKPSLETGPSPSPLNSFLAAFESQKNAEQTNDSPPITAFSAPKRNPLQAYIAATTKSSVPQDPHPKAPGGLQQATSSSPLTDFLVSTSPKNDTSPRIDSSRPGAKQPSSTPSSRRPSVTGRVQSLSPIAAFLGAIQPSTKPSEGSQQSNAKSSSSATVKKEDALDLDVQGENKVGGPDVRSSQRDGAIASKHSSSVVDLVEPGGLSKNEFPRGPTNNGDVKTVGEEKRRKDSPRITSRKSANVSPANPTRKSVANQAVSNQQDECSKKDDVDRSEVVKSVSLKDFSLKETLQKYQRSASGRHAKLEDVDSEEKSEERRRPSLVNSISLRNFSLKDTLAIYQKTSSRSIGHGDRSAEAGELDEGSKE